MNKYTRLLSLFMLVFCSLGLAGMGSDLFDEKLVESLSYRAIGPTWPGGRIVDIAVPDSVPYTFYIASASGGLWKTTNNGTTFEPIFDNQSVISIGDIAIAPSDPATVWVGTGEAANSRSAYWGNGVYKSVDGGENWKHMGLTESHHIGRIVIHPENPDVVYVAALGHLFSFNEERGLYRTMDGGQSWDKVLYIGEKVGVVDVVLNPQNPDILLAATYEKERLPWTFEEAGPGSAIYRTTDGGLSWQKLEGGLPSGNLGRIGLDMYLKNPDIIYATIENANPRPQEKTQAKQSQTGRQRRIPLVGGEIYRTEDGGDTWTKVNAERDNIGGQPGYYYGQIRVDPNDDQTIYVLSVNLFRSRDGGKTWGKGNERNAAPQTHSDHHAIWIDPQNSDHLLLGNDGGFYISYDRGGTWDHYKNLPLAQYYAIGVDMDIPYNVYGGLQDNGSWKGPSNGLSGFVTQEDWVSTGGGDGMYNQVDPTDSRWLYNESQFGYIQRFDQKLGVSQMIRPRSWEGGPALRFNWNSPVVISPHNSQVLYFGGNLLFRSMNRGDDWQPISPDLTGNDPVKTAGKGNIQYCTIVTVSESPITPGLLWVGTDDGKVHLTKKGGGDWSELTKYLVEAGAPEEYWVSRVFASHFFEGTAYVTKTGYRRDDFKPFVYMTRDFGRSWVSIAGNLPNEPINVFVEDRKNQNLLFVGTDMGVHVSIDGGKKWVSMKNNMPTNAVHDLLIHPRENDLVVGTHGRGIFIADIYPLQSMTDKVLEEEAHLFEVEPKAFRTEVGSMFDAFAGHRFFRVANEPEGMSIYYYLKNDLSEGVKISVKDPSGNTLRSLTGSKKAGLNRVIWNMRRTLSREETAQIRQQRGSSASQANLASPGEYLVILEAGDWKQTRRIKILEGD